MAAACSGGDDSTDNGTDGAAASTSPDTAETSSVADDLRLDQMQAMAWCNPVTAPPDCEDAAVEP